jgi:hypothetical protein
LGSSFAGVKAGILAGIFLAGIIGAFNILLLYAMKTSTIDALRQMPDCLSVVATNSTNPLEACFSVVTTELVPAFTVFPIFIISLIFGFIYGRLFERFPGRSYFVKALIISYAMALVIAYLGLEISATVTQRLYLTGFDLLAAGGFAYLLALFYKRYTRVVEFSSAGSDPVKILIKGRNLTGKSATFSTRSSHKIVADASGSKVFKEWACSGGVTVEDAKSYETVMRVDGNGMIKAYSTSPS